MNGCTLRDSIIIEERTCVFSTDNIRICENTAHEGVFYERDTSFETVYNLPTGVDSIVTTNISLLSVIESDQTMIVCEGVTVEVGTSSYTTTGTYIDVFVNSNQCDSIVTTYLIVNPNPEPDILGTKPFCAGDSIFLFIAGSYETYEWTTQANTNGIWIKEGGDYEVTVIDTNLSLIHI